MTVTGGGFLPFLSTIETDGYMKVSVKICNRNSDAQDVTDVDWKLQTPAGNQIDTAFVSVPTLQGGSLVHGGEITGDLYFTVGAQRGGFYVIFSPSSKVFDNARGIWKLTI